MFEDNVHWQQIICSCKQQGLAATCRPSKPNAHSLSKVSIAYHSQGMVGRTLQLSQLRHTGGRQNLPEALSEANHGGQTYLMAC